MRWEKKKNQLLSISESVGFDVCRQLAVAAAVAALITRRSLAFQSHRTDGFMHSLSRRFIPNPSLKILLAVHMKQQSPVASSS